MSINYSSVGHTFPPVTRRWSSRDAILYALGVGAGQGDPTRELDYTTEHGDGSDLLVLPTFASALLGDVPLRYLPEMGDFSLVQVLHAEQRIELYESLPASGEATLTTRVVDIADKRSGALIYTETMLADPITDSPLGTLRYGIFVRGEGGFTSHSRAQDPGWTPPSRAADVVVTYRTAVDQALLYRLSGDHNPLHWDPEFAELAGFSQPILHGLCVYGYAGRALLHTACDSSPDRFGSMQARFTQPVIAGSELKIHVWLQKGTALFQGWSGCEVVLDRGVFETREQSTRSSRATAGRAINPHDVPLDSHSTSPVHKRTLRRPSSTGGS